MWKPISEAPKDGTWLIAFWPVKNELSRVRVTQWGDDVCDDGSGAFIDVDDYIDWTQPTHFMPLPPPPTEEQPL